MEWKKTLPAGGTFELTAFRRWPLANELYYWRDEDGLWHGPFIAVHNRTKHSRPMEDYAIYKWKEYDDADAR